MIERKDILSIPYLKKTTFTGSYEGLRFRFAVQKKQLPPKEGEEKGKENWLKRRDLGKNKESQVGRKRKNRGEN